MNHRPTSRTQSTSSAIPQPASENEKSFQVSAPSISLPKGGGAIRGMGEKFAANPVTGTASMTVPISTSPGRSGLGPQLSLSYDSGAGNGPFGFGWSLSLPSITRKTDKGLPQYIDAEDSDVFILSGAEDLVPVYRQDPDGTWVAGHPGFQRDADGFWVRDPSGRLVVHEDDLDGYRVRRYRPRIEGLFARIERWSKVGESGNVHWRSISKDNILTLYGFDANSRIADPLDASRIFSWLICETRDDKGNAVLYRYKAEDGLGIDPGNAYERNRGPQNDARRTANRYLKRIHYGNRTPLLDNAGHRPRFLDKPQIDTQIGNADWMFEVVFDYDDHDAAAPKTNDNQAKDATGALKYPWKARPDPFSIYRSGFEVRTTRLCQRVLMFHHFPGEAGVERDCLVRSTDFTYSDEVDPTDVRNPVYTFLQAVIQTGYRRNNGGYDKRSLPPVEFKYTEPIVQDAVEAVVPESLENLPIGVDGSAYRWTDLHGEGIPGILTEQADAWFYKRNLSPIPAKLADGREQVKAQFAPLETVALKPNVALSGGAEFMDLAGDGQPDVVVMDGPMPGLYEHDEAEGWQPFRPFTSRLNRDLRDPNLKFVDLDGDGHADVFITENDAFVWHASLAEEGFGPARRVAQALDEEKGPRIVFADGTQSIYLADLSGDGLTDIVRIRNGEVCYWPNLGYGRFGAKITMDNAPTFDNPDQFDHKRIRLADIDGSGTTDIIYLHRVGVRLYFNQSGNSWSKPHLLKVFPRVDDVVSIVPTDLLGNGTACLVWSSPLLGDARRQMRYVNLMGNRKPHLLVKTINNLGAETRVDYAPSTKFYLQDKRAGKPWITRLPFPVHVVERVKTFDHISRNSFVTRYAYHHGYFDGEEREFRGFGMVEQWDTEQISALTVSGAYPQGDNIADASHVPPIHTKTWFHTGIYIGRDKVSRQFEHEYFRELGLTIETARPLLLDDSVLPAGLTPDEDREACRALKGLMLRQEVYADDAGPDATADQIQRARTPYTVTEQNFTVERLQPQANNRHSVFFTHAREAINFNYERNSADPRVSHSLTLAVDAFGNVLKSVAVGYGRCIDAPDAALLPEDREKQRLIHITYAENEFTNAIVNEVDAYRTPGPAESRTYEVRKPQQEKSRDGPLQLYRFEDVRSRVNQSGDGAHDIDYEDIDFVKATEAVANDAGKANDYFRRLIEQVRTLYRPNDLGAAQNDPLNLLPIGTAESMARPGESYKLAFTTGLLDQVYVRRSLKLLSENRADVLAGGGADRGGYVDLDKNGRWWIPSGRMFYSPDSADTAALERDYANQHFFLPHRYRDPFHTSAVSTESFVTYDIHDLLVHETRDALDNRMTVDVNDYRVLQPRLVSDPNRNWTEVTFDVLGMVVGTAIMGKATETVGDVLDASFKSDLTQVELDAFMTKPREASNNPNESVATQIVHDLLGKATTRIVYDLDRFSRIGEPPFAATIARETHVSELQQNQKSKLQISFSYSDGFGREIQKKIQDEPGPVPTRDAAGKIIVGADGQPVLTPNDVSPRWVGSGWTVFNNKGKPVRQYEPFFTDTHRFEFDVGIGVSPVLFYDPIERVVATLHPNHTWEKVVFDPWRQETWDVNDTVLVADPRTDTDVGDFFGRLANTEYLPTWHAFRTDQAHVVAATQRWPDPKTRDAERRAAEKASVHAATPTIAHADSLGRTFLTVAHNRFKYSDTPPTAPPVEEFHSTRIVLDIEGNQREVIDAKDRVVMRYDYDMLGNRVHQASMEAGERWMLNDVAGQPLYAWDSRDHRFRTAYDSLRRPTDSFLREGAGAEIVVGQSIYGETRPNPEASNLRGKVVELRDQAGVATSDLYDFKGNLLWSQRKLAQSYKTTLDWSGAVPLQAETFAGRTRYDALNRPTQLIAPHSDQPETTINVIEPIYNEANLLEQLHAWLNRNAEPAGWLDPSTATLHAVTDIDYDAKGQRTSIDHGTQDGKVIRTSYTYDRDTFRLTHLYTRRGVDPLTAQGVSFTDDCDNPQPPPPTITAPEDPPQGKSCGLQNPHYAYDPAGNITHIRDDAQQTIYFKKKRVEPSAEYTYDAVYRLIEANGREHLGEVGSPPISHSYNDVPRVGLLHPGDGNAMGRYLERYVYDAVGNFLSMQHRGTDPANPGWNRAYAYGESSPLEPGKQSNRLTSTTIGGTNESYSTLGDGYDAHGNMLHMPQLQVMQWDFKDQLQMTRRQAVNPADADGVQHQGERTWYVYDSAGQRVRKVTESAAGQVKDERIYLGGFEVYRRNGANPLVRETLHIMDDKQRIALVETRTHGNEPGVPAELIRYQFGNHLGSVGLELNDQAQIISYEEYTPYGSTSYQAVRSQTETPKRYRYTGRERDDESGLYYNGARYLAPWLGRWVSCDPIGVKNEPNLFHYCGANPINRTDTQGLDWEFTWKPWEWEPLAFAKEEVVPRAVGGLKAGTGLIGMAAGAALCETGLGCAIGGPLFLASADYGGSGLGQVWHGEPQPTVLGHFAGPKAQAVQEQAVEATAMVFSLVGPFIPKAPMPAVPKSPPRVAAVAAGDGAPAARALPAVAEATPTAARAIPAVAEAAPAAGKLRSVGASVWESAAGLRYGPGSAQGNRVLHVLEHAADIPTRAGAHGVFAGGRSAVVGAIDDAYGLARAGGSSVTVQTQGARTIYTVNMGRSVGFVGGQAGAAIGNPAASHIRLVLEGRNVITAFPVIP